MSANIEATQSPMARPTTAERLRPECNSGVALAEAVVVVVPAEAAVVVLAKAVLAEDVVVDRELTDGLNVDGVGPKVLELEEVVTFGWITKLRLLSVLSIKPGG